MSSSAPIRLPEAGVEQLVHVLIEHTSKPRLPPPTPRLLANPWARTIQHHSPGASLRRANL